MVARHRRGCCNRCPLWEQGTGSICIPALQKPGYAVGLPLLNWTETQIMVLKILVLHILHYTESQKGLRFALSSKSWGLVGFLFVCFKVIDTFWWERGGKSGFCFVSLLSCHLMSEGTLNYEVFKLSKVQSSYFTEGCGPYSWSPTCWLLHLQEVCVCQHGQE